MVDWHSFAPELVPALQVPAQMVLDSDVLIGDWAFLQHFFFSTVWLVICVGSDCTLLCDGGLCL